MSQDSPIQASIEVVPRQVLDAVDLDTWFPSGTRVYLPDVGGAPFDELVSSAAHLRANNYEPVPHFPARRIKDKAELKLRLDRLTSEAGVNDILIIGGGLDRPVGNFSSTMDLLDTGLFDNYGINLIRIAGHPEGTPDFSEEAALQALRYKQAFNDRTDAVLTIVTQFGFDADSFTKWADSLASLGIDLPVHIGVVGPAKLTTLIKYAVMCGVGPSLQFLKKRASALTTLMSGFDPDIVVNPIEKQVQANPESAIKQIHVFPFGGARKASSWLCERGSWPQV